nr:DMT family transporter [Arthrobacter sp. CAN_C5]
MQHRVFFAAGATVILWASAFVGIRMVGESFSPGSLTLFRLLVASVCLTVLVFLRKPVFPQRRDRLFIVGFGVAWFAGYNYALNAAEQLLDAGTTALLVNIGPILIAVLSAVVLKEGFPRLLMWGTLVAFAGVALVAVTAGSGDRIDPAGVFLALLAAVLYAVGVVVQKPVVGRVDSVMATWLGCLVGTVVTAPFAVSLVAEIPEASPAAAWGVIYLGVFPTAIAFTTWAYALQHTTAGKLGATTFLVPAVAILLSWIVLRETPSLWALLGGGVCLLGVAITRRESAPRERPKQADLPKAITSPPPR